MVFQYITNLFRTKQDVSFASPSEFTTTLTDKLKSPGPKRILALDGGGLRGAMSIAILERIEEMLRHRHGNDPNFRLCDYFDLIGGTSTGSIIAAALAAKRYSASEIKELYFELGPKVFRPSLLRQGITRAKFDGKVLLKFLESEFGDMTLGDPHIQSGLAVIAKRIDTESTWVMHNNPASPFFADPVDGSYIGNGRYPLKNIVRASTAAPHYFSPERIEIVEGKESGLFIDGAITPHNDPAFQLLMLAGISAHGYNWTFGESDLLITSIGTGAASDKTDPALLDKKLNASKTVKALTSMITSNGDFIELLMLWLGKSRNPRPIDLEIGDLAGDFLSAGPLFTYQRYQCRLSSQLLRQELGLDVNEADVEILRDMTNPKTLQLSYDLGVEIAKIMVDQGDYPESFDLRQANG